MNPGPAGTAEKSRTEANKKKREIEDCQEVTYTEATRTLKDGQRR
jgi:hypothetical protein